MHRYCVSGLAVESEIPLLGLIDGDGADAPDVIIRTRSVPAPVGSDAGGNWEGDAERFVMRVPGIGRFLIEQGRVITVDPEDGVPPADVAVYLTGSIFGILLHQRGQIVLHASAVTVGGAAVLFCGPSGAGKSTLAAMLGQRGYPLASDDLCALAVAGDGSATIRPDGRQHKLWGNAIDALDLGTRRGGAVLHRLDKFYVQPDRSAAGPIPVAAIYLLAAATGDIPQGIRRPKPVECVQGVLREAYRPYLVNRMGQRPKYFAAVAKLAEADRVFSLVRPLDFAASARTIGWLEAHWREIGLIEARS